MTLRKIQLIAGTTYSVSLPKDWVIKNQLKERSEIQITEQNNRTLLISPQTLEQKELKEISIDVDENIKDITQIIFAVYYLGVETINLSSKKDLPKDVKAKIRKAMTQLSGAVISYEDKQKITIRVLLDRSKIDITQVLYRMSLIIEMSIANILEDLDVNEIRINENEIDSLYHLITKIISLALVDSNILASSKIKNVSPSDRDWEPNLLLKTFCSCYLLMPKFRWLLMRTELICLPEIPRC